MKLKRLLCATALCAVALTACGSSDKNDSDAEKETTSDNIAENSDVSNDKSEAETEAESSLYVNFDNMTFTLCGKVYTFGETTLLELVEDGVPFDEDSLTNMYDTLASDSISGTYEIVLDSDTNFECYITVINDSEMPVAYGDCVVCSLEVETESLADQSVLEFSFSSDLTKEELENDAGKPDDADSYFTSEGVRIDTYTYKKASEIYTSYSTYEFEFTDGILSYVSITYIP